MDFKRQLKEGLITQNPVTVQLLGMCSTMAITTSLFNGIGMGISVLVILTLSNIFIAALRKVIPNKIRIACFIVVIATFVTVVDLILKAYVQSLSESLGVFIPLIVVNCIILGRAESYASKNPVLPSIFDGIGMGLGFTVGLTAIGIVRELLGSGKAFNVQILPSSYEPITIFILAPGAFFVLAGLTALQNKAKKRAEAKGDPRAELIGCGTDCASCGKKAVCGVSAPAAKAEAGKPAAAEKPEAGKSADAGKTE